MVTRQQSQQRDRREHLQGEYYIQNPEISSTCESNSLLSTFMYSPECRMSYRNHINHANNPVSVAQKQEFSFGDRLAFKKGCVHYISCGQKKDQPSSTKGSVIALCGIFSCAIVILFWIYTGFPALQAEEKAFLKIPWNLEDAKNLGTVLYRYKADHFYHVYFGVCMLYIFLQTFAIPGSLFLSVLSGFLFSFSQAMFLVSICSAIGASFCFLISHLLGRRIIFKYFPEQAESWGNTVVKHRDNLLNYVIFLRITPFLPNWFINLTAPVIGVPLKPFALGTLIGVMPPSFVALQAGQTLHSMSADDAKISWTSMILLIAFGCVALLPIYFKDRLRKKFE